MSPLYTKPAISVSEQHLAPYRAVVGTICGLGTMVHCTLAQATAAIPEVASTVGALLATAVGTAFADRLGLALVATLGLALADMLGSALSGYTWFGACGYTWLDASGYTYFGNCY